MSVRKHGALPMIEQKTGNLTVVLNGYRRPHVLKEQYEAIMDIERSVGNE